MKNRMQLTFLINELIKYPPLLLIIIIYNNTVKEYNSIYAASKDLQINSGIIIYSCKNMHKPKKRYTFCYKKSLKEKIFRYIIYRRDG